MSSSGFVSALGCSRLKSGFVLEFIPTWEIQEIIIPKPFDRPKSTQRQHTETKGTSNTTSSEFNSGETSNPNWETVYMVTEEYSSKMAVSWKTRTGSGTVPDKGDKYTRSLTNNTTQYSLCL